MQMHQIKYFLAVCNTLNFRRAADHCNVAQSSLSRAIKQLEDELGGQLFRREHLGTHMTDLARLLQPHFASVRTEMQSVKAKARAYNSGEAGSVTLGVTPTICPGHLSDILQLARQMAPNLEIVLTVADRMDLLSRMQQGLIDLSVMPNGISLPPRFDNIPLFLEGFVVAFPPGHRFEASDEVQLHDLDGEPLIMRSHCEYHERFEQIAADNEVHLRYSAQSHDELWLQSMIQLGFGAAVLPNQLRLREGLQSRPLADERMRREIVLVHVRGRRHTPSLKLMHRLFADHDWARSVTEVRRDDSAPASTS